MIAVSGAAGKTGLAIIQALARRGQEVRGLVHKEGDQAKVAAAGAIEVVVGDLSRPITLEKLLDGAAALYHICPNMHSHEVAIGATILAAAQAAKLDHLVYHSVLHPQTEAMPHHWQKCKVEELIFASGIPFTILQPAAYMQNLLGYWQEIRQRALYRVPYPVTTRLSLVDVMDVAEVAALVLTETGHLGATYELVGSAPLTQMEVAAVISEHMGQPVVAAELALEEWKVGAIAGGLRDYAVQTLEQMFRYYAAYGLIGNPRVLGWLLQREPTSLTQFVEELVAQER